MKDAKIVINNDNIVLEIDDVENCRFELWTLDDKTTSSVKIKIPHHMWLQIVEEWNKQRGKK
jgi:hypothetical protein